jgi:hypothetical protein
MKSDITPNASHTPFLDTGVQIALMMKLAGGLYINRLKATLDDYPAMQLEINDQRYLLLILCLILSVINDITAHSGTDALENYHRWQKCGGNFCFTHDMQPQRTLQNRKYFLDKAHEIPEGILGNDHWKEFLVVHP